MLNCIESLLFKIKYPYISDLTLFFAFLIGMGQDFFYKALTGKLKLIECFLTPYNTSLNWKLFLSSFFFSLHFVTLLHWFWYCLLTNSQCSLYYAFMY